jgi:RimJ/RimL family protein N-acetyltransferase
VRGAAKRRAGYLELQFRADTNGACVRRRESPVPQNEFDQPVGFAVPGWTARERPPATPITGQYCRIEKLDAARHACDLWAAYGDAPDARVWTYLFNGPFAGFEDYAAAARLMADSADPYHYAIIDAATGKAAGTAALMRIDPAHGVIEVGNITYFRRLSRSRAGTEAMYLLMRRAFDELGYRRYEWKCDSLNAASRAAAERYGFEFEGIFRQAVIYKGRSRDTAWYAIIDRDWPLVRAAFEAWLAIENFDAAENQRRSLRAIRQELKPLPISPEG